MLKAIQEIVSGNVTSKEDPRTTATNFSTVPEQGSTEFMNLAKQSPLITDAYTIENITEVDLQKQVGYPGPPMISMDLPTPEMPSPFQYPNLPPQEVIYFSGQPEDRYLAYLESHTGDVEVVEIGIRTPLLTANTLDHARYPLDMPENIGIKVIMPSDASTPFLLLEGDGLIPALVNDYYRRAQVLPLKDEGRYIAHKILVTASSAQDLPRGANRQISSLLKEISESGNFTAEQMLSRLSTILKSFIFKDDPEAFKIQFGKYMLDTMVIELGGPINEYIKEVLAHIVDSSSDRILSIAAENPNFLEASDLIYPSQSTITSYFNQIQKTATLRNSSPSHTYPLLPYIVTTRHTGPMHFGDNKPNLDQLPLDS